MTDTNKQINTVDYDYLYKKTEKLVSAIYLLSSFISDKEPVKWQFREVGLKLLAQNLPLSDRAFQGGPLVDLILSYFEIAYLGGIISRMNHDILKAEFENLRKMISDDEAGRLRGAVLSEQFFTSTTPVYPKGQISLSDRPTRPLENRLSVKPVLAGRQEVIISLLRKNNELGIKDFSLSIRDCSEKTIQRELAVLVSKGQVIKKGEKRWSRYSLK